MPTNDAKYPSFGRIRGEAAVSGRVLRQGRLHHKSVDLIESDILVIGSGGKIGTKVLDAPWVGEHPLDPERIYAYSLRFGLVRLDAPSIASLEEHFGEAFLRLGQGLLAARAACRVREVRERMVGLIAGYTAANEPIVYWVICSRSARERVQNAHRIASVVEAHV